MSAKAEPIPADKKAYDGVRIHPHNKTTQSPRLKYPCDENGILIMYVATHTSAAKIEDRTIFPVFVCFILLPLVI